MKINAAIQLLPLAEKPARMTAIDKAIGLIQDSGLNYKVCPFETVVEGESQEIYALIQEIQERTLADGCAELLLNVKIHAASRNLSFDEKLEKYRE